MSPVLLAVAHGSRDPAAQDCVLSLTGRVATLAGGTRVATAFVQNAAPSLAVGLHDAVAPGRLRTGWSWYRCCFPAGIT